MCAVASFSFLFQLIFSFYFISFVTILNKVERWECFVATAVTKLRRQTTLLSHNFSSFFFYSFYLAVFFFWAFHLSFNLFLCCEKIRKWMKKKRWVERTLNDPNPKREGVRWNKMIVLRFNLLGKWQQQQWISVLHILIHFLFFLLRTWTCTRCNQIASEKN